MTGATVTRLAFVRTASGVARVEKGAAVPGDALESEVERLVTAGVITTGDAAGPQDSGEALGEGGDPTPVEGNQLPARGRGRGQTPKVD